jgi:DNA-binding LacI/PurR family transcriptional regulator
LVAGKRVTIADVAKATGVSPGAISRILNNDPTLNVRDETKETVRRAIAELGYIPNPQARGLRLARSGSLAMIVPEINSPAFVAIIQGAQRAAYELGYSMLIGGIGEEGENPNLAARILSGNRVDGFLISTGKQEARQLAAVQQLGAPAVLVNRYLNERFPHVMLDDEAGVALTVRHLAELGHERIGFLGSTRRFLGTRRLTGFKQGLAQCGLRFDKRFVVNCGYDREGGEAGAHAVLALIDRPTAVFATNHLVAAGVLRVARQRGLSVPGALSVASFYDGPVADLLTPAITSVAYPLDQLGYEAVRMLVRLIVGDLLVATGVTIQPTGLVIRQSTGIISEES